MSKDQDYNKQYDYVLEYIEEATHSRQALKTIIERSTLAYKKRPSRNIYAENANSFYQSVESNVNWDVQRRSELKAVCDSIPDGRDDTIFNAVETVVSMAMGGVGQFLCVPVDRHLEKDPELVDRQETFLDYTYNQNGLDGMAPETVRKLFMQGQFNYLIQPKEDGKYKISLIDAYKMLFDPRRSKSNRERFIGFTEVSGWRDIKDNLKKHDDHYILDSVNDVDTYVGEINNWYLPANGSERFTNELSTDLDTFSSIYSIGNKKGSRAKDKKGKVIAPTDNGYVGDDIEIAYVWDIENKIYFKVVNRRFIVSAKENPLSSSIDVKNFIINDEGEFEEKVDKVKVELDSPIVHVGLINADWETYPISPLWYCLDDFDQLCAKQSIKEHNLSIMAPITFISNSYDAEILSGLSQIAGQIAEGTSANIGVLNKSHDMSAILSTIQDAQASIKRTMGATDQYELMQLLNNRATGAEVSMANAAVSQRMNIALAKLEEGHKQVMEKILKLNIIDNDKKEFYFPYKDGVSIMKDAELYGTSITEVRLKSRIKVEMQEQSRNALMVLQTVVSLAQSGAIDLEKAFSILIPRIMQGTVSRREAVAMISDKMHFSTEDIKEIMVKQEEVRRQEEERKRQAQAQGPIQNATPGELAQIEQLINSGELPADYLDQMSGASPEQPQSAGTPPPEVLQALGAKIEGQGGQPIPMAESPSGPVPSGPVPSELPLAADGQTPMPRGMSPEQAGQIANEQ